MAEGIETRHRQSCRTRQGGRCNCTPSHRGKVVIAETGERLRSKWSTDPALATAWRREALNALALGLRPGDSGPDTTVAQAIDALLDGMRDGRILTRSGRRYRPSTIRGYEIAAERHIKRALAPRALGQRRLTAVRRRDVQDVIEELRAKGLAASSIHNKLDVLRVVFRRALQREDVTVDPFTHLELPAIRRSERQVADPARASALLDALPDADRALWAALFYGGLRISEARALRWSDVDLERDHGELRVRRGWDDVEGELDDPKTDAGRREVPLAGRLRTELVRHKLATGRGGEDLVFGRTATQAPDRSTIRRRALKAWGWKEVRDERGKRVWDKAREDALDRLTPHEARHTCASYLIAAGLNDMQLQRYIGHTDVRTTKNVYGHLFPGDGERVAAALDAFLDGRSRGTHVGP